MHISHGIMHDTHVIWRHCIPREADMWGLGKGGDDLVLGHRSRSSLSTEGMNHQLFACWIVLTLCAWENGCHFKNMISLIARFMGSTWGPSGADRTQVGPMLAPWTLLSGSQTLFFSTGNASRYIACYWPNFPIMYRATWISWNI